jgi:hypothetical protein
MAGLPAKAFNGGNRHQMGSNIYTTIAQGGGAKKAGFPYQIGRSSWSSIAFLTCNPDKEYNSRPCASLKCMQFTTHPNVHQSRPIGSNYYPNTYYHIPGTRN